MIKLPPDLIKSQLYLFCLTLFISFTTGNLLGDTPDNTLPEYLALNTFLDSDEDAFDTAYSNEGILNTGDVYHSAINVTPGVITDITLIVGGPDVLVTITTPPTGVAPFTYNFDLNGANLGFLFIGDNNVPIQNSIDVPGVDPSNSATFPLSTTGSLTQQFLNAGVDGNTFYDIRVTDATDCPSEGTYRVRVDVVFADGSCGTQPDTDGDGNCNDTDPDDDNDGVADGDDTDPTNPYICQDLDGDGCDDCAVGIDGFGPLMDFDPANDGTDTDGDGICDDGEGSPGCNGLVTLPLDANCQGLITKAMMAADPTVDLSNFTIELFRDREMTMFINSTGVVGASEIGTVYVNLCPPPGATFPCCWGEVLVEEKQYPPIIDCTCEDYMPVDLNDFSLLGIFEGNTYYVSTAELTWAAAKTAAEDAKGHLSKITSAEENTFISDALGDVHAWIGLTDDETYGGTEADMDPTNGWVWPDGEQPTYTNWNGGEPNNQGNEDYVEIRGDGTWNDESGSDLRVFVLEIKGICEFDCDDDLSVIVPPTANDVCDGPVDPTLISDITMEVDMDDNCALGYDKIIERTWEATDATGNTSTICVQRYYVALGSIANATPPPNYDGLDQPRLDCEKRETAGSGVNIGWNAIDPGEYVNSALEDLYVGHPSPDDELNPDGTVKWHGTGRPGGEAACSTIKATFTDLFLLPDGSTCQNGAESGCFELLRTWLLTDWCTSDITEFQQIIKVIDNKGPEITDIDDLTISTQPWTCDAIWYATVPQIDDNCSEFSGDYTVSVDEPSATVYFNETIDKWIISGLPLGVYTVTYYAEDCCGNPTEETIQLSVEDLVPPTPVCNSQLTQVGLGIDGNAKIFAHTFDDGSHDVCQEMVYFKVIRKDDLLGTPNGAADDQTTGACNAMNSDDDDIVAGDQIYFDDHAKFCCVDIGDQALLVVLRVFDVDPGAGPVEPSRMAIGGDLYGRFNDCEAQVEVRDFLPPYIECPSDVTLSCAFNIQGLPNLDDFGTVVTDAADRETHTIIDPSPSNPNQSILDGIASDNCTVTVSGPVIDDGLNNCGVGTITRTFTATDGVGNSSSCTQTITVILFNGFAESDITWPSPEVEVDCANGTHPDDLPVADGKPQFVDPGVCALLDTNFVDEPYDFDQDNAAHCKKIIRRWKMIDWCQFNPDDTDLNTIPDVTDDGIIPGRWTFMQIIKVLDSNDPIVTCPSPDPVTGNSSSTTSVIATPTSDCLASSSYTVEFDAATGLPDATGDGLDASQVFPAGIHTVTFTITDNCGKTASCSVMVDIDNPCEDVLVGELFDFGALACERTIFPSDVYIGTETNVTINGMNELLVTPSDINGIVHPTVLDITVNVNGTDCPTNIVLNDVTGPLEGCQAQNIIIGGSDPYVFQQGDLNASSLDLCYGTNLTFEYDPPEVLCSDFPSGHPTGNNILLISITISDPAGNSSVCDLEVSFFSDGTCNNLPTGASIAGIVSNEEGLEVEDVEVRISDEAFMMTQSDGTYMLDDLSPNEDYLVRPYFNEDADNGISTFDLVLMSKHILNIEPLPSPYKLIAADVNKSGTITTLDMVELRKLILYISSEFQYNTSWRFVDEDYVFINPENPFEEAFPEYHDVINLSENMQDVDFVAVKVGDLNCSASTSSIIQATSRSFDGAFEIYADDQKLNTEDTYTVGFKASEIEALEGFQFTMAFDKDALEIVNIEGNERIGFSETNFGHTFLEKGLLTTSYVNNTHTKISKGDLLFTLEFKALKAGNLSDYLSINSQLTKAEAYARGVLENNTPADYLNVTLNFENDNTFVAKKLRLFQNRPNPFKNETLISFQLPERTYAKLSIYDVSGRILKVIEDTYEQGFNEIHLNSAELPARGVMYYQLETDNDVAVKKMMIID